MRTDILLNYLKSSVTCRRDSARDGRPAAPARLPEKLRGRTGETIAETLVALLISCVGLMLLAGMIMSSTRLVTRSRDLMETYYSRNNLLETRQNGDAAGNLTITLRPEGTDSRLKEETFSAVYFENSTVPGKSVISYLCGPQ